MRTKLALLVLATCLAGNLGACQRQDGAASIRPADGKYAIKLVRPLAPGQTYQIEQSTKETGTETTRLDGAVVKVNNSSQETRFRGTKTRTSAAGTEPAEFELTVERLTFKDAAGQRTLLPSGSRLTSRREGENRSYYVRGLLLEAELQKLVQGVLGNGADLEATDDEIMGSEVPRALGESWAVNHKAMMSSFEQAGLNVATASGDTTLTSVRAVDGIDVMELNTTLHLNDVEIPDLPDGSRILESEIEAQLSGLFPLDDKLPCLSSSTKMTMKLKIQVPIEGGKLMDLEMTSTEVRDFAWYPAASPT